MSDESFLRVVEGEKTVPMTKDEVRARSLCILCLSVDAVVYDVWSGTGSIAVECAKCSPGIRVYAIEQKATAQQLLRRNPAVGYDSHYGRHEQRGNAHRREETADLQSREVESAAQIGAQRNKPRAPDGVLEEVHNDKAKLNSHNSLILRYFNFWFILVRKRLKQMYEIFFGIFFAIEK